MLYLYVCTTLRKNYVPSIQLKFILASISNERWCWVNVDAWTHSIIKEFNLACHLHLWGNENYLKTYLADGRQSIEQTRVLELYSFVQKNLFSIWKKMPSLSMMSIVISGTKKDSHFRHHQLQEHVWCFPIPFPKPILCSLSSEAKFWLVTNIHRFLFILFFTAAAFVQTAIDVDVFVLDSNVKNQYYNLR